MNLYQVISEEICDFYAYPPECYRICELVAAKSRSQAKYLAWKSDKSYEASILEMPKFSIRLIKKDIEEAVPVVVTAKYDCAANWKIDNL